MKPIVFLFLLAGALGLAGCDGHSRVLYLSPLGSPAPRGSFGSPVIRVEGGEDVLAIVEQVARELDMHADPNAAQRWFVRTTYNNSFMLAARKEPAGYWLISLADWPTIGRSEQSKQAEEKIRAALRKKPNQALEPTRGAVMPPADAAVTPAPRAAHL